MRMERLTSNITFPTHSPQIKVQFIQLYLFFQVSLYTPHVLYAET